MQHNRKIFAIRLHSKTAIEVVTELQNRAVDVLYWEGSKSHFEAVSKNKRLFPNTIFHNTFEAIRGIPAHGVDTSSFEPVNKEILSAFLECESRALSMMNSIDIRGAPFSKRKRIYHTYLKYWYNILSRMGPDAVIFGDIPHLAFHYVIYSVAKQLGIQTIIYKTTAIPGRLSFLRDIFRYHNLEKSLRDIRGANTRLSLLSPDIRSYYEKQTNPLTNKTPFYVQRENLKERKRGSYALPRTRVILKHATAGTLLKTARSYLTMFFRKKTIGDIDGFQRNGLFFMWKEWQWDRMKKKFKQEYERLQTSVDYSKKFVYVALQNQPECSTSAMGDIFVDQILMIDILRAAIPDDWAVYVKESPLQWSGPRTQLGRHKGYYEEIAAMKNVFLVPVETPTLTLIDHAQTTASITGTAPWEAILRGKSALVFGHVWFMYCAGVFKVNSLATCRQAIEKIQNGHKPSQQDVVHFLAAVDKATVRGFPNKKFKEGYGIELSDEENVHNIANGFYQELINPVT